MKITVFKTNKEIQEVPESNTERRVVDGFFLTITDGMLIDVEYGDTSADVITIPDDVKIIGKRAFEDVYVQEVILPAGIESIEDGAFRHSTLKKIDLTNVKTMGNNVFESSGLREVTYSKYLTYIPEMCFKRTKLAEFKVPKQVKILEDSCFENTNLKTINLSGITNLGVRIFFECFNLREIILPETITEIPHDFCYKCQCLEKINLSHVKVIGACAFSECSKLDAGSLSAKIGKRAFEGTAVRHLEIEDISKVDDGTYRSCDKLESVIINGNGIIPIGLFSGCNRLKDVAIREGITDIGCSAFRNIAAKKIFLPSTVITINDEAFAGCKQLEEAVLDEKLHSIGHQTFMDTTLLSEISIPDGVEYIGSECFSYSGIRNVKLPENGFFTIVHKKTFFECVNLKEVVLPDSVCQIDDCAFANCKSLQNINLDKIQLLDNYVFERTALEHVTLTAGKIGSGVFAQCKNLKKADLSGVSASQINCHLFFECTNLTKVSLPKNQIRIFNDNCFYHTAIKEITFDAKRIIVSPNAFGLTNLKKVVISENCDDILFQNDAFRLAEIDEFVIPDFLEKVVNNNLDRIF